MIGVPLRLMVLFPPGKGGGDGVAHGFKGKGVLIHSLVDAQGMPLAVEVTCAKSSERAQVIHLLELIDIQTGKVGRPRCRPSQLAADKGYDSKELRKQLKSRGIRPEIPKRVWKDRKQPPGPKVQKKVQRFVVERCFAWYQRKFRRLALRWERNPQAFKAFVSLAFSLIWLERLLVG